MEKAQIFYRLGLLEHYPAPLSKRGKELVGAAKQAFLTKRDIPGEALAVLETLPRWMFESYFQGMKNREVKALFDVCLGTPRHLRRFLTETEGAVEVFSFKIVNVTKGCSTQCDFCYAFSGGQVVYTPWVWILELAEKLAPYDHDVNFDADALRDYYDPLFDKDFGDVARVIKFQRISTSGFEEGSIGERAAFKIAEDRKDHYLVVNFSLMSNWARRLGRERYVQAMANVFRILDPEEVYFFHNGKNYSETMDAYRAAGGNKDKYSSSRPHPEGKALHLPAEHTHSQGRSVLTRSTFILEPNAEIAFVQQKGESHERFTLRRPGERFLRGFDIGDLYTLMLIRQMAVFMESLVGSCT